jgi:hypothetical protein
MIAFRQTAQLLTRALPSYFILVTIYVLLILVLPADQYTSNLYNFSPLAYRVVLFGVAFPSMLVWLAAFVGYDMLRQYAHSIRKTAQGEHFRQLASGCAWLAWSLPLSVISAFTLHAMSDHWNGLTSASVILSNYIYLIFPLIAFIKIGNGSRGLLNSSKITYDISNSRLIMLLFAVFGVIYCYFTFNHFNLGSLASSNNPFHMPVWLTVLTVTIPSLYAWFVGILAAYEINLFSKNIRGVLYRQATRWFVLGLIIVIMSLIAQQYIVAVQPRSGHLVLDFRLFLLLLILIIRGLGFILVALGAFKLKRFEEV